MADDSKLNLDESLKPLCKAWLGKIALAKKGKEHFNSVGEQCMGFFGGATGFMWESKFQSKFMNGSLTPRFKMTFAKAFEMVAVFGPNLYWKNPRREVKARKPLQFGPELFGDPQDPQAQQAHQQAMQELQVRHAEDSMRAGLIENYLNITPDIQPCGLAAHSEQGITESLVKGRGCSWVRPYSLPETNRVLTGAFYDSVDNLLIDPDCMDASMMDAKWIAQECIHSYYDVEKEYGHKPESLKKYAVYESADQSGESMGQEDRSYNRQQGDTRDLIRYYKIWSKCGLGHRMVDMKDGVKDQFTKTVGDYAYIVIAPNCPFPLNAPEKFLSKAYPEQVKARFSWPIPFWKMGSWPVAVLDYYRKPMSAWPIAPIEPGLGELMFLNVMQSALANRIWSSSRDFICIPKSAMKEFADKFKGGDDLCLIEFSDGHSRPVNELIEVLQMPQTNKDVWQIIDAVTHTFELRTGLSEFTIQGSTQGAQSRSAADVHAKQQQSGIRPEFMAGKVEDWQDQIARMEQFCAGMFVKDIDVIPFFGKMGAYAWKKYVEDLDDEEVALGMQVTVAAGSAKKPNKTRDTENMQALSQNVLPLLAQYAMASKDTKPFNFFLDSMGDAMDQELGGMHLGEWPPEQPPVDPNAQAQQEHEQQMGQQEMQMQGQAHQQEMEQGQREIQAKERETEMKMQLEQMKLQAQQAKMQMDAQAQQQDMHFKQAQGQMDMEVKAQTAQQDMELQRVQGAQQIKLAEAQGAQQLQQAKQQGDAKVQVMKKQAAAKPKPKPKQP